jgi:hypothetical protein
MRVKSEPGIQQLSPLFEEGLKLVAHSSPFIYLFTAMFSIRATRMSRLSQAARAVSSQIQPSKLKGKYFFSPIC